MKNCPVSAALCDCWRRSSVTLKVKNFTGENYWESDQRIKDCTQLVNSSLWIKTLPNLKNSWRKATLHSCLGNEVKGKIRWLPFCPIGNHAQLGYYLAEAALKDYTFSSLWANFMADLLSVRECDRSVLSQQERLDPVAFDDSVNGMHSSDDSF